MTGAALSLPEVAKTLMDPRHGIIRNCAETPRMNGCAPLFLAGAMPVQAAFFNDLEGERYRADEAVAGAGLSREEALWALIGETLERYSARIPAAHPPGKLCVATFDGLGADAVDPRSMLFYDEAQYARADFKYRRFRADRRRLWVKGRSLVAGEDKFVAAHFVWLRDHVADPEEILCQVVSSGLACGVDETHAQLSGVLEVIERDAFMATWLLRRPPPRLDIEPIRARLGPALLSLLAYPHLETSLYLLTTDIPVPVVMGMVRSPDGRRTAIGCAAHADLVIAIRRAAVEAHHTWAWAQTLAKKPCPATHEIKSFDDHVRFYLEPDHQHHLDFLDDGGVLAADCGDPGADRARLLVGVMRVLDRAGYEPIFVNLTTADVAQLGLTVGRVVVPGLHPIASGVGNMPLEPRRVRRVARHWAWPMPERLNTAPHPFP